MLFLSIFIYEVNGLIIQGFITWDEITNNRDKLVCISTQLYSIDHRFEIGALLFFPDVAVRIINQVRFTGGGDETLSKAEMVTMTEN